MTDIAGTPNESMAGDAAREDLELEEGWRAAAAAGYDTDMTIDAGVLRCEGCGGTAPVTHANFDDAVFVRDTATGRDDLAVHQLHCPRCGRATRLVAHAALMADVADAATAADAPAAADAPGRDTGEVDAHHTTDRTASAPLGDDRQFYDPGGPGNLRDREDLIDAQGDDKRMYTGEPVETEDGWVLPRQQNVGPGNMAGDGEFPDPNTPPSTEPPAA